MFVPQFTLLVGLLVTSCHVAHGQDSACRDQSLIADATQTAERTSRNFLYHEIKILEGPSNIRQNPYYHSITPSDDIFADHDTQCVSDVLTDHHEMDFYYGWEVIHGQQYVIIKLVPKIKIANSQSNVPDTNAMPITSANWDDVLPKVRDGCAHQWPNDFQMQATCVIEQRQGWDELNNQYSVPASPAASLAPPTSTATNPVPTRVRPSQGFTDGLNARIDYEQWKMGMADGEYRNGVLFWTTHRDDKIPPICDKYAADFARGCRDAQNRLVASDIRRKLEPDFRLGWRSFVKT